MREVETETESKLEHGIVAVSTTRNGNKKGLVKNDNGKNGREEMAMTMKEPVVLHI